ncbi:hypothetical protein [Flavobacterium sp.]|uniref:hypothetical protein n=1 Tax=Flavobacterium sp. TaxID=239 RepID=UPI00261DCBA6|nr:hypothetical protein [Flavobacterium sp.]MDG2431159.1 hypothetical protein [Flavobacterium sp.]
MKTQKLKNPVQNLKNAALLLLATITLVSCNKEEISNLKPTAAKFAAIRETALEHQTQNFNATAGAGTITLTSAKGVIITLNGNALTKNGNPVTGAIDITYIEFFDKGTMLVTNKPTIGLMANGNKSILKSGGEFFISASQAGVALVSTGVIQLQIPAHLTGTVDTGMVFWTGNTNDEENLVWEQPTPLPLNAGFGPERGNVGFNHTNYNMTFGTFGWTNVDRFMSDPRPKTTILVEAPTGYDDTNSAIYLSYDGEGQNALAKLDTYNSTTAQFSEHYGQIPIGLACHVIFATEDNGQWRYAIKAVTVQANDVYTFTLAETIVGTEGQLIAAINAIQ